MQVLEAQETFGRTFRKLVVGLSTAGANSSTPRGDEPFVNLEMKTGTTKVFCYSKQMQLLQQTDVTLHQTGKSNLIDIVKR